MTFRSLYINNMGRKLRKIMDERMLVLVQKEMDQVIFRATMGMYDNQPPQSHVQNTPSPGVLCMDADNDSCL